MQHGLDVEHGRDFLRRLSQFGHSQRRRLADNVERRDLRELA
jgi:hypothetical protein